MSTTDANLKLTIMATAPQVEDKDQYMQMVHELYDWIKASMDEDDNVSQFKPEVVQ